eukprot:tig00020704_g13218.t1
MGGAAESQAVSESIGLLRTMRLYGGAGPPHADGALYRAPRTASAVQLSTSAAAAPSGTPTPVPDARRCPPPAAARRPPCPPPEAERFGRSLAAVKPRQSLDLGGLVRTRTRRLADLDPVKSRPRPIRKIIDDFPEMWRLARMDETVRTRSGYVPHEMLNELRGMFHKEYYIPVRNIFRYYAHLDGAKGRVPLPLPLLPLPLTRPAGVQVKAIAVRARHGDGEEMYTVNKRAGIAGSLCSDGSFRESLKGPAHSWGRVPLSRDSWEPLQRRVGPGRSQEPEPGSLASRSPAPGQALGVHVRAIAGLRTRRSTAPKVRVPAPASSAPPSQARARALAPPFVSLPAFARAERG